jgi:hypothetical protein
MLDLYRELLARPTVDIRDPAQVEMWTRTLNIYTADLVEAVSRVGHASTAVLEHLLQAGAARRGG